MKALVVGGGQEPTYKQLLEYAKDIDIVVGVDKGCQYLYRNNIVPNMIVGDFDSSEKEIIDYLEGKGSVRYQYNSDKDATDSEIAFSLLFEKQVEEIMFLGATGKRFDHGWANVGLLLKALENGVKAFIIDENNIIYLINKGTTIRKIKGYKYISFMAYNKNIDKFSINNAKYDLENYLLKVGDCRTISNEFIEDTISINFDEGIVMVIHSTD